MTKEECDIELAKYGATIEKLDDDMFPYDYRITLKNGDKITLRESKQPYVVALAWAKNKTSVMDNS